MRIDEVDKTKVSPMMLHYIEIKKKYPDTIVFYRLGDFYEMFFEDAVLVSHELELTLTGRNAGLEERVPMCGIPYHAYQSYVEKLVNKGYKVAICEQLEDPKEAKGIVDRDVIQVITKGTILDNLLNEKDNNFLASIYDYGYSYSLTYADISTGEIYSIIVDKENDLYREIVNKGINEVIANDKIDRNILYTLKNDYHISITITNDLSDEYSYVYEDINDIRLINGIKHLISYIVSTKKSSLSHLKKVSCINEEDYLQFDIHTQKNLELTETIRDNNRQYSLLWLLDKTKTAMGSRFLKQNIESPLRNKEEIERRYDIISKLLTEFIYKEDLIKLLDEVYDLERLAGRISYGNANARDMLQLLRSLKVLPNIRSILSAINYDRDFDPLEELCNLLESSINDNPPITLHEGGLIKDGYNSELDKLKSVRKNSKDFILQIEASEKERTGIKNLKVGYNKVFGYYIEVSKGNIPLIQDSWGYIRKQTLTTGERYITEELKEKEQIILGAEEKIINLEYNLFMEIRDKVKEKIPTLQEVSKVISELDMLISFSVVSEENNYTRPTITDERVIRIIDSRHPVVEKVNKSDYVPNDIIMDKNTDILLITGPNMAGKSTYMRQLAIIVIMAQIGCFVPAKSCSIPLFDKIFTRIGASDDLVSGESTFMVEMKEANRALTDGTVNSLILFDELGRGTATYDGMSLAEAILEYIHNNIHAKTLFSTHYHELTKMTQNLKKVKNVHVSASEDNGNITFLHKVVNGSIDKSYGINVASLAHLPREVIDRANEILNIYENQKDSKKNSKFQQTSFDFIEEKEDNSNRIEEELKSIDPLNMTPIDALNKLYELVNEVKENNNG
jgi:DNA mismatch repair protein MutS